MIILSLLALAALGVIWVHWVEPNWFHLRHETVRIRKSLTGPLTILHLSDLHLTKPRFFMSRFFDRLSRLHVDFVFVTGDLIDGPGGILPCIASLKKLKPRHGIYAVLGNHDYQCYPLSKQLHRIITRKHYGRERSETNHLKKALREAGIHLMENQNTLVAVKGQEICLIGVDDPVTGHSNLRQAFRGVKNEKLQITLVHSPRTFPALKKRGIDIAFSGHTHGGQLRLPKLGPLPGVKRLERIIDSTHRYGFAGLVSRGMGANPSIRVRLFCRPEAVLVRVEE